MADTGALDDISSRVRACTDCPLSSSRTHAVPGEGPADAKIIFIGEAPGFHEDRQGRPFVGPAGRFLEELLGSAGLKREDVFIANMVKCRPPDNRDPLPAEIATCSKYLDGQIELIGPKLIVTLGRFSLSKFFPRETITRARGKARKVGDLTVYPIMHPAAALHRQELRKVIEEDFRGIPALLKELQKELQETEGPTGDSAEPQQLNLF